jgi:predicted HicB family RNase H-like nuclease
MKTSDQYLKLVSWSDEDQCYIGRAPGLFFGGVHGDDEVDVYRQLTCEVEEWLQACEEDGRPLPPPTARRHRSGNFRLRVGEELHERLVLESMKADQSLNSYCVKVTRQSVEHPWRP